MRRQALSELPRSRRVLLVLTMPDLDDLMAAVVSGNLPEVRSMLDAPGAAPAIFDGQENTVIWMACMHAGGADSNTIEREGIVNALLRAGAPPNPLSRPPAVGALGTGEPA